ncbi:MAG: FHA domain-containing protein, partial [Gammaproteobacteria bacterium]|nr:FHA domain-containing protein [Gammaproteobacteria bacterium]
MSNGDAHKTVVSIRRDTAEGPARACPLRISWRTGDGQQTREFTGAITVGRDESCEIRLADECVSRIHANIYPAGGRWHVADVDSANGTYLDRVPIREAILPAKSTLQLGQDGPMLWLDVPGADVDTSVEEIAEHYFGDTSEREVGHRTMMLRRAYQRVDKRQKRRYRGMIAGAVAL